MKTAVQISRFFVGVLFIISGLIKANDPLGFSYKLKEYFEVFEMPFFVGMALPLAMIVCVFEIIVGVLLLIGSYVKLNSWLLLLMILFFTWLTGYSALYNKVTDCGCFG
ncbi:MAG: DoxX family membrane protein, partial [Bacteroidia bacterium]|nr:DoxX family membrane protein [Bacteroidia bacterium]